MVKESLRPCEFGSYPGGSAGLDPVPNKAEMKVIKRMQAMRKDGATYRAIGAVTGHGPRSVMRILERVGEASS
jgi:hypothetical protein